MREFSIVTISLPTTVRVTEFKAYVIGVHRRVATLQPVEGVEAMWLPEHVKEVLMSFQHGAQTVGLRGELRSDGRPDELRFRVTDGVYVPRRRSSRLKLCAPAVVTPVDDGREIACQTHDVGADGIRLEGANGLRPKDVVTVSVSLPEIHEPIRANTVVAEVRDDLASLEFIGLERDARRVLGGFVTDELRRRLNIVRALRDEEDDDWD